MVAKAVRRVMTFLYESPLLELEIYRVLTILEASPALAEFEGEGEKDRNGVVHLRRFEDPEVSRIVVSLAAIVRSSIDANKRYYEIVHKRDLIRSVGTLWPDADKRAESGLLVFRDACNKTLHADLVEPERTPETLALTGKLVLHGSPMGKPDVRWEAELDLRKYALTTLFLAP